LYPLLEATSTTGEGGKRDYKNNGEKEKWSRSRLIEDESGKEKTPM